MTGRDECLRAREREIWEDTGWDRVGFFPTATPSKAAVGP